MNYRVAAPVGSAGSLTVTLMIAEEGSADPVHIGTAGPILRWCRAVWNATPDHRASLNRAWRRDMARMAVQLISKDQALIWKEVRGFSSTVIASMARIK